MEFKMPSQDSENLELFLLTASELELERRLISIEVETLRRERLRLLANVAWWRGMFWVVLLNGAALVAGLTAGFGGWLK